MSEQHCILTLNYILSSLHVTLAARDSANIWGGSRVLLVTDLPNNATVNVDKLYTSLADRGLADVFNRLVIIQRGHDGHFIKTHGSFRALSRVQDRWEWRRMALLNYVRLLSKTVLEIETACDFNCLGSRAIKAISRIGSWNHSSGKNCLMYSALYYFSS